MPTNEKPAAKRPLPTVSRMLEDGTLIELLYDAGKRQTALAVSLSDGTSSIVTQVDLPTGERLVPYSAENNLIASGCVLLPPDIGEFGDKGDLLAEIRAFIHRYVDVSPAFEDIAAHYVLLTWVYDAFKELGALRLRGDYGTGKTRGLLAIGSLCYKPFFASGASTVSPIFHILDAFRGTLILDEADFRFSDATAELTKVLNNGTVDGLPVLRTMSNRHRELNPQAFRVFGPKLIAMRGHFNDKALESRFITEETGGRSLRTDIPIHTPDALATEAAALRAKLLAWRFAARRTIAPDPGRALAGVEPRINQTALALLSLVDEEDARRRICAALMVEHEARRADRSESVEAAMVAALAEAFAASNAANVPVNEVATRFNARAGLELGQVMSNKWVGSFLRNRLHLRTLKTAGVYAVPREERSRVAALAERFGTMASPTSPQSP